MSFARLANRLRPKSLSGRVKLLLALIVLGSSAIEWISFTQIAHRQAEVQLRKEMDRAKRVLQTLFDARRYSLESQAGILADSPKFRSLVLADAATFRDVAPDLRKSLGSNHLALYGQDNRFLGSTSAAFAMHDAIARHHIQSNDPWSGLEMHDGQLIVASWQPILVGGEHHGTMCLFSVVGDDIAKSLSSTTGSDVAFFTRGSIVGTSASVNARVTFDAKDPQRFDRDGEEIIGQFAPLLGSESPATGFFVMKSVAELEGPIRQLNLVLLVCIVVTLIASIFVGSSFVRNITQPLAEVAKAAEDVRRGAWPEAFQAPDDDEIGSLQIAFNRMISAIHASQERLLAMIDVDPLTELTNHRAFKERIHQEIARCSRDGDPLALLFVDVDKFADFNAKNGHAAGDQVLVTVARLVKEVAPDEAVVARYGGEEFAVLIPGGDAEQAESLGNAILEAAHDTISLSIGCADLRVGIEETDALILAGELALSRAKQLGRSRVCRFDLALESNDPFELHKLQDGSFATIRALAAAVDAKDSYTLGHSERVAAYAKRLALYVGASAELAETVERCGFLHDVGKIGVPDAILKKPERLTDEERAIMETHPVLGEVIVRKVPQLEELLPGVRWHHERWDGRGYPDGLAGEDIPLVARFLAVADTFDAMTSDRPYRKGLPLEIALSEIEKGAGTQFDPDLAIAFVKLLQAEERKAA